MLAGRPGQTRTNFFIDFAEWRLREFKLRRVCPTATTCTLRFDHVTVKTNPAEELFSGAHARASDFQTTFIGQVRRLASGDLNQIAMSVSNNFNEFESSAQSGAVLYRNGTTAALRSRIQTELTQLGSRLTPNNILDRASTQICGGCHQLSAGTTLGGGLTWPTSGGFVHIDESGGLSPALTNVFLPHRKRVLEKFITDRERGSIGLPGELIDETIAGRPADSAN